MQVLDQLTHSWIHFTEECPQNDDGGEKLKKITRLETDSQSVEL